MRGLHFQTVAVFLCPLAMRVTILMFPTILRLCHFMWARGAGSRPTAPGSAPSPLAVHRFPLSLRDPCLGVPRPGILLLSLWVKLGESLRFAQRSLHSPGGTQCLKEAASPFSNSTPRLRSICDRHPQAFPQFRYLTDRGRRSLLNAAIIGKRSSISLRSDGDHVVPQRFKKP